MLNYEMFDKEKQPTESELREFVGTETFTDLHNYLCDSYNIKLNWHILVALWIIIYGVDGILNIKKVVNHYAQFIHSKDIFSF